LRDCIFPSHHPAPVYMSSLVMEDGENVNPSPVITSPATKKSKLSADNFVEVLTYEKSAVDAFIEHFRSSIERAETEVLYWSTLYEESQKEISELKKKLDKVKAAEEADYIDPQGIPEDGYPAVERSGPSVTSIPVSPVGPSITKRIFSMGPMGPMKSALSFKFGPFGGNDAR
jgi:hypothetical protein